MTNVQKKKATALDCTHIGLCSGHGQYHSINNMTHPQPYTTITLEKIEALINDPPCVAKEEAQWAIFSDLPSRVHAEQREKGCFYAIWADIDDTQGMTFKDIVSRAQEVIPEADFLSYTSRSATRSNQKLRIIVGLSEPVDGQTYVILQKILNDKLEAAGIIPDRATERTGQICYLPNKGDFYDYHIERFSGHLDISLWDREISQERQNVEARDSDFEERRRFAEFIAKQRMASGCMSPIDAFNGAYQIELMLEAYGYMKKGKRWLSPNSQSGEPGVTITDDGRKWLSAHDSDSSIGKKTKNGTMGDSFDLFVHYQHNGDRDAAIKAAGEMFVVDGITLTKMNQRAHMGAHAPIEKMSRNQPILDAYVLNDRVKEMEAKMEEDRFVLGRMAILGQSTVFYAKPNAGKTLLVIWLLIEAIESSEISGEDVYYINADDTYKGLVHKTSLADKHGFKMMAPGHQGFKAGYLPEILQELIALNSAGGKILILDTVKKFTDLMNKSKASEFGESVRQFVSHGGTVIMLAHANKHRGDNNEVIYSGTSDLVDDADCVYTLDTVIEEESSWLRTVKFKNIKSRGNVDREAVYRYDYADDTHYDERLESVEEVGREERQAAEKQKKLNAILERNQLAVDAIKDCINENINKKTELIREASDRSGLSKKKITRALSDHTGENIDENQFWYVDKQDKNAHVYQLNNEVS